MVGNATEIMSDAMEEITGFKPETIRCLNNNCKGKCLVTKELLKKIGEIKKRYSKKQSELYKKSKDKNNPMRKLNEHGVDVYRIRLEELDNIEELLKGD